jgi:hypothetical protein
MALTKNVIFLPVGFDVPAQINDAYIRVDSISGNKNKITASVVIGKKTEDSFLIAQSFNCSFVPNMQSRNFIVQAYEHLKNLPEFVDAIDC